MSDSGILDGDLVVIKPANTAKNGQIVFALVNDEATLKEFKRIDGGRRIELIPHSKKHKSQIYGADAVEIQGILQTVVRSYSSK